jgi:Prokaryotic homologs of the JAB domain
MAGMNRPRPDQNAPTVDDAGPGGDVHRRTPLPSASARGHLIVPEAVVVTTLTALRGFHGPDGRHEGIVFWAGRQDGTDQLVAAAIVPRAVHGRGFIHVDANEVGEAAHQARARRLVLLGQVHSHPGADTRHSDADDDLVLMARETMFSLVVADYGDGGITPAGGAGVHQLQDDRWVRISDADTSLIVVPAAVHT